MLASRVDARPEKRGMSPASDGVYVVFDSAPGFDLVLTTLDPQTAGDQPELVAVQRVLLGDLPVEACHGVRA